MKEIIKLRRHYRRLAETAWLEMKTTMEIIKYLKNLGIEVFYGKKIHTERVGLPDESEIRKHASAIDTSDYDFETDEILQGYTGAVAVIKSSLPGKNTALRFDIDALPITESNEDDHIPNIMNFSSLNSGSCHACGHDGHIALGLSTAKFIKENIGRLKGSYTIIFQPAEEGVKGASSMVNTEFLNNIDYIIGCHIGMNVQKNIIEIGSEGFLATKKYDVIYRGMASHAGISPEKGNNALLGAASCIMNLYSITQYGDGNAKLNVGTLNAGTGRNLIPQKAVMQMEIRADRNEILEDLDTKAKNIIKCSAMAFGLEYEIKKMGEAPTFKSRHRDEIEKIADYLENSGIKIEKFRNFGGSEDVSYMLQKVEDSGGIGIHIIIGADLKAPHHNEKFDYNEDALLLGEKAIQEIIEYINN